VSYSQSDSVDYLKTKPALRLLNCGVTEFCRIVDYGDFTTTLLGAINFIVFGLADTDSCDFFMQSRPTITVTIEGTVTNFSRNPHQVCEQISFVKGLSIPGTSYQTV